MRLRPRLPQHLRTQRLDRAVSVASRVTDVLVVLALTPIALPLAALIAIGILIDSPGPVLHRAVRVGRDGRPFAMWKFRTMVRDAAGEPLRVAMDARETPFGALLSRSRLNELPQLFNVLRGDMRLVGPRPEDAQFVREYPDEFAEILTVAPGLTGPGQLAALHEPVVLAAVAHEDRRRAYVQDLLPAKLDADLRYVRERSPRGDAGLLLATVLRPLRGGVRAPRSLQPTPIALSVSLLVLYATQIG